MSDNRKLPTIEELGGSDMDFTGALSTEEYIREIRNAVDADILQMDQEDMVDEIMTLRISLRASVDEIKKVEAALKEAVKLKSEWYDTAAKVLLTGFKRVAVMDEATCDVCRERNGSLILDVGELTRDCMMDGGCRCAAVPV